MEFEFDENCKPLRPIFERAQKILFPFYFDTPQGELYVGEEFEFDGNLFAPNLLEETIDVIVRADAYHKIYNSQIPKYLGYMIEEGASLLVREWLLDESLQIVREERLEELGTKARKHKEMGEIKEFSSTIYDSLALGISYSLYCTYGGDYIRKVLQHDSLNVLGALLSVPDSLDKIVDVLKDFNEEIAQKGL